MKATIDTENRTIRLKESVTIQELNEYLEKIAGEDAVNYTIIVDKSEIVLRTDKPILNYIISKPYRGTPYDPYNPWRVYC